MGADVTVNRRGRHFDEWRMPEGSFIYQTGGGISNRQPWDGSSEEWTPESFTLADIVNEGGNIRSISSGHWKYAFNKGTTTQGGIAGNEFRVYPIRGNHSVFYSIAPQTPVDLSYEVIPSRKAIKIYKDAPDVQYAFYVGIDGWKLANFLRATYGSDTFQQKFNVRLEGGIQRVGRFLVYQGKVVGKLPTPIFTENVTGNVHDITESLNDGELTLSIAGLNALDLSQGGIFDPTLGPVSPTADTHLYLAAPGSGSGADFRNQMGKQTNFILRPLQKYDISAIPAGVTVTSTSWDVYVTNVWGTYSTAYTAARMNLSGIEYGNGFGIPANWQDYKEPDVGWPGGQGGWGDIDAGVTGTSTGAEFTGTGALSITILDAIAQDAIDNRSGIMEWLMRYDGEGVVPDDRIAWASSNHPTSAWRPTLSVVYSAAGTFNRSRIVNTGSTGPQNRSTIANA